MKTLVGSAFYNFDQWFKYTATYWQKSQEYGVSMDQLDTALWSFDKA